MNVLLLEAAVVTATALTHRVAIDVTVLRDTKAPTVMQVRYTVLLYCYV